MGTIEGRYEIEFCTFLLQDGAFQQIAMPNTRN